jgi:hypothetical protein
MAKKCTLRVESRNNRRHLYLQFATDSELYDWLDEIYLRCPGTGVVDYETFSHDLHIREPDEAGNIRGFPRALAEFVDLYSIRSSIGSSTSAAAPGLDQSETGMSSADSAPVITPKSTMPGAAIDLAGSDDDSENNFQIPRVDLPDDHIGFAPPRIQNLGLPNPKPVIGAQPGPSGQHISNRISWSSVAAIVDVQGRNYTGKQAVVHVRDLTRGIKHISRYPLASGGYSDVYRGQA